MMGLFIPGITKEMFKNGSLEKAFEILDKLIESEVKHENS